MMRAVIFGSNLGSDCWSDALLYAVNLKNRLPHQSLQNNVTPHEAWNSEKPDLSHLRVLAVFCMERNLKLEEVTLMLP